MFWQSNPSKIGDDGMCAATTASEGVKNSSSICVYTFFCCFKSILYEQTKEDTEESWGEYFALRDK